MVIHSICGQFQVPHANILLATDDHFFRQGAEKNDHRNSDSSSTTRKPRSCAKHCRARSATLGTRCGWVADNCSASMAAFLLDQFKLDPDALYQERGPVNLVRLMQVPDWVDRLAVGEGASARYATIAAPGPYLPNAARIAICASKYRKLRRSVIALHACSIRPTPKSSN